MMPASWSHLPRLLPGFCLVLTGLASALALAWGAAPPARPLVLGSLEEPGSLSALADLPHHFPGDAPQTLLFDSLIQYLPDGGVGPKLAQRWEVSAGGTVVTFHLAANARFHDGRPVTAEDVKFTVEAARDPATKSSDEGFDSVERVEAVNPLTVRFTLKRVTPRFLVEGGSRGIVPKHLLEGKDLSRDPFNRQPIGSGAFKLVGFTPGQSIVFEGVPEHYRGAPRIGRVVFKILPDQNVMLTQLRSGEIQYALVEPRDLPVVEKIQGVRVLEVPTTRFYDITPNFQRPYWQDRRVREAVLRAMDREGIVKRLLGGHGQVIHANATPASWAHTPDVPRYSFDPARAQALLAEAGWVPASDGIREKAGQRLSFAVMVKHVDRTLEQVLVVAQQQLKQVGVEMRIERLEPGVFTSRMRAGQFDALSRIWNPVYDPDQSVLYRAGNRYGGYSNPEVDALLAKGLTVTDRAQRKRIYGDIQRLLAQDIARLYLYSENELHALATDLAGATPHPVNLFWNLNQWSWGR
jgi:peptide/nickel transport system substrate-binding protein